jgi:hypothetical protein
MNSNWRRKMSCAHHLHAGALNRPDRGGEVALAVLAFPALLEALRGRRLDAEEHFLEPGLHHQLA